MSLICNNITIPGKLKAYKTDIQITDSEAGKVDFIQTVGDQTD